MLHVCSLAAVLGEERLLEGGLATDEIEELVTRRGLDDRRDRTRHPHPEDVVLRGDLADAGQALELRSRHAARET